MKSPNIRHTLLFIVIIFTMNNAFAQKSDVGFDFGFGKTEPKPMNPLDVLSFNNELQHYLNVDLNYSYTPNSAFFRFKGGFDYSFRDRHSLSLNYIKIPIGFDLIFGKKLKPFLGIGLYAAIYLLTT